MLTDEAIQQLRSWIRAQDSYELRDIGGKLLDCIATQQATIEELRSEMYAIRKGVYR